MTATREEVYQILDGEREYQNARWNAATTTSGGLHTPTEFLVYMQHYLSKAIEASSTNPDPLASRLVLENIRKITALGVACMEQNGAIPRE